MRPLLLVLLLGCGGADTAPLQDCGTNGLCPTDFSCHASDNKCVKTGTVGAGVTASAVASDSHQVDKVSPRDGPITTDGHNDAAFDLTVTGPIAALALVTTDADGNRIGGQIWDTIVGTSPIPAEFMVGFTKGSQTWQVGVFEGGQLANKADGSLPTLDGTHLVRMYASDSGWFVSGKNFRLIALLPDGTISYGPVFPYPPGAL